MIEKGDDYLNIYKYDKKSILDKILSNLYK